MSLLAALVLLFNPEKIINLFNKSSEKPSLLHTSRSIFLTLEPLISSNCTVLQAEEQSLEFSSNNTIYTIYISEPENQELPLYTLLFKKGSNTPQILANNIAKDTTNTTALFNLTYNNKEGNNETITANIKIINLELTLQANDTTFKAKTAFFIQPDTINIQSK